MKQTVESASLEYFDKNSRCRPEMELVIRTAFEAGAEWKEKNLNNQQKKETMKVRIKRKSVKYLKLDAGVRFFENAEVNGIQDDNDNPKVPFAVFCKAEKGLWHDMYRWRPVINIETGQIVDWPKGVNADIYYKVCDDGTYSLLDEDKNVLIEVNSYVPDVLCPKEEGYGDYIIMDIDEDGYIAEWKCNQRQIDDLIKGDFNYKEG